MADIATEQTARPSRVKRIAAVLFVSISALATLASGFLSFRFHESLDHIDAELNSLEERTRIRPDVSQKTFEGYLKSVCYLYTQYGLSYGGLSPAFSSVAGTGFVVRKGMMATNRHIVEPWWDDSTVSILHGVEVRFRVNKIVAFCPGISRPILLTDVAVSPKSDLALARFNPPSEAELAPLPLADARPEVGEPVALLGYPAGVVAMLAKAPPETRARIVNISDPLRLMRAIAGKSLLRPLATYGRLGDVTGYRLVYDAHTAPGGSGGPLIDSHEQVIAINTAFINNFTGENLGVPVQDLKTLLHNAESHSDTGKSSPTRPGIVTSSLESGGVMSNSRSDNQTNYPRTAANQSCR